MARKVKSKKKRLLTKVCKEMPPKPKTMHKLDITSVEDYRKLREYELKTFENMVQSVSSFLFTSAHSIS